MINKYKPKLCNLPAAQQEEIVKERIKNTHALRNLAKSSRDPIVRASVELDILAKSMGVYMEYSEELDPEEDDYDY